MRDAPPVPRRDKRWPFLVAIAMSVAAVVLAGVFLPSARSEDLLAFASDLRTRADAPLAPLVALVVYIGGVTVGLPTSLLSAVTMLIFGVATGGTIAFAGVLVGGSVVYAVGRFAVRDLVERWLVLRRDAWFERLHATWARRGFVTVVLLRLTPIPYAVANLALGATRIRFVHFLFGTALGILPSLALVAALTRGLDLWLLARDRTSGQLAAVALAAVFAGATALSIASFARSRKARAAANIEPQDQ